MAQKLKISYCSITSARVQIPESVKYPTGLEVRVKSGDKGERGH